jgi:hypothetical protein
VAGQSITFDFLSRGAASLSRDFRSIGDDSALSSRGVKVLSDVIERLGAKEDRTAAESKILAGALRQTGDAADRATAKAVLADAAIRRLGDAEQDTAKKSDGLGKALGGLKLNPGLAGPALALAPAIATLGGVAAGAGVALAGAFAAGGAALAAFGAVAKPVLTDAQKAAQAVEKAQNNYNIAIANGTKPAAAYKAEQIAIAKAYADLSPAQIRLSQQLGAMSKAWDAVKTAQTPVIAGALQPWLKSVTDLTGKLAPVIAAVAPVIGRIGTQVGILINSSAFTTFRNFIAGTGSKAVGAAGNLLTGFLDALITLLPKFNPLIQQATGWIGGLGGSIARWANSQKTADQITAFMAWFKTNGPVVGGLLANIALALKALAPGLTSGGLTELKVISDFLGLVAKLPPGLAKPLTEVAASMLILNKLGVISVGIKLVGLGTAGAGAAGGPLAGAGAGIAAGIVLKIREDLKSGFTGIIKDIPTWFSFGTLGSIVISAQGWADLIVSKIRHSLLSWEDDVRHRIAKTFDGIRHDVAPIWDSVWNNTVTRAANGVRDVGKWLGSLRAGAAAAWDQVRAAAATAWDTIWRNTVTRVQNGVADTVRFIAGLPGKITGVLGAAGTVLLGWGKGVITGLLSGMTSVITQVWDFIKSIPGKILSFLGIKSPPQWAIDAGRHIMNGLGIGMAQAQTAGQKALAAYKQSVASVPAGGGGPVSAGANAAQGYAASRLGAYGWGAAQMKPLIMLWNQESGWNRLAYNASSGATGIPQALPYTKMPRAAWLPSQGGQASASAQIDWGLGYIKGRYGSPAGAWAHEVANNWYDRGGWLMPGLTLAHNETGRPELIIPGEGFDKLAAELRALRGQVAELIRTTAAVPAATGAHVAAGVNAAGADAVFRRRYPASR